MYEGSVIQRVAIDDGTVVARRPPVPAIVYPKNNVNVFGTRRGVGMVSQSGWGNFVKPDNIPILDTEVNDYLGQITGQHSPPVDVVNMQTRGTLKTVKNDQLQVTDSHINVDVVKATSSILRPKDHSDVITGTTRRTETDMPVPLVKANDATVVTASGIIETNISNENMVDGQAFFTDTVDSFGGVPIASSNTKPRVGQIANTKKTNTWVTASNGNTNNAGLEVTDSNIGQTRDVNRGRTVIAVESQSNFVDRTNDPLMSTIDVESNAQASPSLSRNAEPNRRSELGITDSVQRTNAEISGQHFNTDMFVNKAVDFNRAVSMDSSRDPIRELNLNRNVDITRDVVFDASDKNFGTNRDASAENIGSLSTVLSSDVEATKVNTTIEKSRRLIVVKDKPSLGGIAKDHLEMMVNGDARINNFNPSLTVTPPPSNQGSVSIVPDVMPPIDAKFDASFESFRTGSIKRTNVNSPTTGFNDRTSKSVNKITIHSNEFSNMDTNTFSEQALAPTQLDSAIWDINRLENGRPMPVKTIININIICIGDQQNITESNNYDV